MIAVPAVPEFVLGTPWQTHSVERSRSTLDLRVKGHGKDVAVRVERCAANRLRDSYPVGAHDLEARVDEQCPLPVLTLVLRSVKEAATAADPSCRRIVFATRPGDRGRITAAEAAGFRYVVDIDLGDHEASLLVSEPGWVTRTDIDLDRVPGA